MIGQGWAQAQSWEREGRLLDIAGNVSPQTLLKPGMIEDVRCLLDRDHVTPEGAKLEIMEATQPERLAWMEPVVRRLCNVGVRLAIGDFGSAYASMRMLSALPFMELKVGRSLVTGKVRCHKSTLILETESESPRSCTLSCIAAALEGEGVRQLRSRRASPSSRLVQR